MSNGAPPLPWKPIAELKDLYHPNLLLQAPELVDLDCNEAGIGMGYWQDLPGRHQTGCFLCCKWNMTDDVWNEVECRPTHFIILKGAAYGKRK